ncbi:MAG: hypothetical protein AB1714_30915 [Acidobacteriota bacterium]
MTEPPNISLQQKDVLVFGLLGVATFVLLILLEWHWLAIAAWLMGREQVIFDQQSPWVRGLQTFIGYVPWLTCAGRNHGQFPRHRHDGDVAILLLGQPSEELSQRSEMIGVRPGKEGPS